MVCLVCFIADVDSADYPHAAVSEQCSAHLSLAPGSGGGVMQRRAEFWLCSYMSHSGKVGHKASVAQN